MTSPASVLGSRPGSLREACGIAVTECAAAMDDVVVLDADVAGGTGFHHFRKAYPDRFIQCGIAEQNMVAMAAGMATFGYIPVVSTYAVFSCMRALEMVRNAIALPCLNVKITGSHVGLDAGPDGATHQCVEDLAIMRAIPNLTVLAPADRYEMKRAIRAVLSFEGPVYLRTGRSPNPDVYSADETERPFVPGKADLLFAGEDVGLIGVGVMVARCVEARRLLASEGVDAAVLNMSSIKPFDEDSVVGLAAQTGALVTAEDHNVVGGLGDGISTVVCGRAPVPVEKVGIADVFGESGEPDELAAKFRLTAKDIVEAARRVLRRKDEHLS